MKKTSSQGVYILDGARTIIGNPYKSLRPYSSAQLGAVVISELVNRHRIRKNQVNGVILGNVVSAGAGQNIARQAVMAAGLSSATAAFTVNNVCGAGLQAVISGAQAILAQDADLVICGGAESATHAPYIADKDDIDKHKPSAWKDSILTDGLFCAMSQKRMGDLAEKLSQQHRISRQEQDRYAFRSHNNAAAAQREGKLRVEIVPLKDSNGAVITKDDRPRASLTLEALSALPPAFAKPGSVTSGNSSSPCDGAAAVLLASSKALANSKFRPKARILGYASIATDPALTFETISLVIQACLSKTKLTVKDIGLFEISEAFSAQMIFAVRKAKIPEDRLNVCGGDIAFGHPLGAAGARILVTLINSLIDRRKRVGLACVSYGGGGALGVVIENLT